jgi:hypothetical protein
LGTRTHSRTPGVVLFVPTRGKNKINSFSPVYTRYFGKPHGGAQAAS